MEGTMRLSVIFFATIATLGGLLFAGDRSLPDHAEALSSHDYLEATAAAEKLFRGGKAAIPFLVANLRNESPFCGLCGSRVLESEIDFDSGVSVETATAGMSGGDPQRPVTVREASLYLILAILKNDLFFASECRAIVCVNDDHGGGLDSAACEVAILFVRCEHTGSPFSAGTVEEILRKHGVSFS